ncbi:biotin synthase auxiliary protein BsaP [Corynebacterium sp. S7]
MRFTTNDSLAIALLTGEEPVFHPITGQPCGAEQVLSPSARVGLEVPRYCQICGRRMKVQIRPDGWSAECSRHGAVDSSDLGPT